MFNLFFAFINKVLTQALKNKCTMYAPVGYEKLFEKAIFKKFIWLVDQDHHHSVDRTAWFFKAWILQELSKNFVSLTFTQEKWGEKQAFRLMIFCHQHSCKTAYIELFVLIVKPIHPIFYIIWFYFHLRIKWHSCERVSKFYLCSIRITE